MAGYLFGHIGDPNYLGWFSRGEWFNYSWNEGWLVVYDQGWPFWVYYPQWC